MPAGYAHYVFGQKVIERLDSQHQEIINQYIDLFNIGVHGPDILFYALTSSQKQLSKLGGQMHNELASTFFLNAKEVLKHSQNKEANLAYIYGFICHYSLDHACHGHIYKMQDDLNMSHYEIEAELDRKILANKGLDPLSTILTSHIHPHSFNADVIAPYFLLDNKPLTGKQVKSALKRLVVILNMFVAKSKIKRNFVFSIMKLLGLYETHRYLLINYEENKKSINDINILIQKLDQAVDLTASLIHEFDHHELNEIYNYNFKK